MAGWKDRLQDGERNKYSESVLVTGGQEIDTVNREFGPPKHEREGRRTLWRE